MKTITITFLILITTFSSCKMDSNSVKGFYDSMHFVRDGGGQIDFIVQTTDNSDKVKVIVSKYNFRDTTLQFLIDKNADNAIAFSSFHNALNSQTQINGDFKQSTLETGTWSYIYFISNGKETEVTNSELRNSLLKFEQITTSMIK